MLQKFIQQYNQLKQTHQKQNLLRQIISDIKKAEGDGILKQFQQKYEEISKIFKCHPEISMEFLFQKLSIEECIGLIQNFNQDKLSHGNSLLRLFKDIGNSAKTNKSYIEWFSKMYTRYSSIQKLLIFMQQLVHNCQQNFSDEYFFEFIPDFIKASALAITSYFKLKSEAPKFQFEYIEHGQKLVKFIQSWVKDFYLIFIKNLRTFPQISAFHIPSLNAICDIIGALVEIQREGNIQSCVCEQILSQSFRYVQKITTLRKFSSIYLSHLRSKDFSIPHRKIQIPSSYMSSLINFPKQSYCFIAVEFLKQSLELYSDQSIISYLLPVINELSQYEYAFKQWVEKVFLEKMASNNVKIKTFFEGNIPLSVVWFNLWHYRQKGNQKLLSVIDGVYDHLRQTDIFTYVKNLQVLSTLHLQDLDSQTNQFIAEKAISLSKSDAEFLVGLIKLLSWTSLNQKGDTLWNEILSNMSSNDKVRNSLLKTMGLKRNRTQFQDKVFKIVSN